MYRCYQDQLKIQHRWGALVSVAWGAGTFVKTSMMLNATYEFCAAKEMPFSGKAYLNIEKQCNAHNLTAQV